MPTIYDVKLDSEFSGRLRRQTADEAAEMKSSIDQHGYLNPLIIWKETGLLVDGHHRYRDWQNRMSEYEKSKPGALGAMFGRSGAVKPPTPELLLMSFASREDVLVFIAKLQYGKRNLTEGQMALLRAEFMKRESAVRGVSEACALASAAYDISEKTARRDLKFAESVEVLVPLVEAEGGDLLEQIQDPELMPDRSGIIAAAALAVENPSEAVKLATTPLRKKKSAVKAKADATPRWERLLAKHKKELQDLLAQIGDDRKLVQQVRRGYRANYEELFAKPEVKDAAA